MKQTYLKLKELDEATEQQVIVPAPVSGAPVEILSEQEMIRRAGGRSGQMTTPPLTYGSFCTSKLLQ